MNADLPDGTPPIGAASDLKFLAAILGPDEFGIDRQKTRELRRGADLARSSAPGPDEAAMARREKLVAVREQAALLRENAALLREVTAASRELEMHTAAIAAHTMLRQHEVAAIILEAHALATRVDAAPAEALPSHDGLTGLPNRLLLQDRLVLALDLARRQGTRLAVFFMGLDRFKHINDSLGHAIGDQLLQAVARCLLPCVRHTDTVSRAGGDEFVLLLPCIEDAESAAMCAQKMLTALARPQSIAGHDLYVSASIGVALFPDDGQDAATLMKSADGAMYHAKQNGGNNYLFFEQDMNARAVHRQVVEASLRRALERQEFVLHYQPKINLQSGAISGVEALIRWQHPQRGLLAPSEFVPVAEDCGLILPIGRWVLREACLQARAWRQAGLAPISIAVNTSALEFRAKDFLDNIRATLAETEMPPDCLELELTENVLMRDTEASNLVLRALAGLGVRLALDDFGTGYSSLSYLRQFPIDSVKIDQSFVNQMSSNPDDASIVNAVISMGQSLKKCVIAEGVETEEQAALLLAQHCDVGQGYYFGRPMPAAELAAQLRPVTHGAQH